MTNIIDTLKEAFAVQIERGVSNLFFFTQEEHPGNSDSWRARAFPADKLEELASYLQEYTYYRNTNNFPRFYKGFYKP